MYLQQLVMTGPWLHTKVGHSEFSQAENEELREIVFEKVLGQAKSISISSHVAPFTRFVMVYR